jgi:hypothetical protein
MSLGYFSFALPMSVVMSRHGFPYGSKVMVLHHGLVFVAQATYLLTQYPSGYMALSGFLFELTNVFFIPHILLIQTSYGPPMLQTVLGASLVCVYTVARCVACTVLAVRSLSDLAHFAPPTEATACWLATLVGLSCFWGLLFVSWYWYFTSILPSLHAGLQSACGDTYYYVCVPAPLRRFLWIRFSPEGRESRAIARKRFEALRELREEQEASAMASVAHDEEDERA